MSSDISKTLYKNAFQAACGVAGKDNDPRPTQKNHFSQAVNEGSADIASKKLLDLIRSSDNDQVDDLADRHHFRARIARPLVAYL